MEIVSIPSPRLAGNQPPHQAQDWWGNRLHTKPAKSGARLSHDGLGAKSLNQQSEAQGRGEISTSMEDFTGGSTVIRTVSEDLQIQLFHFEPENVTLNDDYLWQVVEIVIGGVQTGIEVHYMCLFMSLDRKLLQGSVSSNLFDSMGHQVDLLEIEVGF